MCMVFFFVFFPALFFLPTKPESWCDSQHRLRSLSFAKGGIESTGLFSDLPRVTQGSGVKEGSRRLPSDSWPTTLSPWPYCSLCVACTLCQGNTMLIKDMELTTLKTWQKNFWRISNNKTPPLLPWIQVHARFSTMALWLVFKVTLAFTCAQIHG